MSLANKQTSDILRGLIRLIHCLQKERGISCSVACGTSRTGYIQEDEDDFNSSPLNQVHKRVGSMSSLDRSRNKIKNSAGSLVVTFSDMMHKIRLETDMALKWLQEGIGLNGRSQAERFNRKIETVKMYLRNSRAFVDEEILSVKASVIISHVLSAFECFNAGVNLLVTDACRIIVSMNATITEEKNQIEKECKEGDIGICENCSALLSLLDAFIQKKERSGRERAMLVSLRSCDGEDLTSALTDNPKLYNEIIIGLEAQKMLIASIEKCKKRLRRSAYKNVASLVEESLEVPLNMKNLLEHVRSGLNLELIRSISVVTLMDMWSFYIDKIHAAELLLLEAIEPLVLAHEEQRSKIRNSANPSTVDSLVRNRQIRQYPSMLSLSSKISSSSAVIIEENDDYLLEQGGSISVQIVDTKSIYSLSSVAAFEDEERSFIEEKLQDSDKTVEANDDGWTIPIEEIKFLKRIGVGGASTNYLAKWHGENVCVKVASVTKLGLDGWRTEVKSLQRIHHPNIIRLLGTIYNQEPLTCCLVLDYCNLGDLGSILGDSKKYSNLPKDFFIRIAEDIASGMKFLHSRNILHRDIKPANVLLSGELCFDKFKAQLTDFGVAKLSNFASIQTSPLNENEDLELTAETGTYRYMAPEVIRHERYSYKADVYSYALVILQIFTRKEPFDEVDAIEAARLVAIEERRPRISSSIPRIISELIEKCWADPPSSRPSFELICEELSVMRPLFTCHGSAD
eukprot:CAMPEP_0116059852 /NCGR_PEP_ID=MMETSP0322-20121206/6056_1 /TAXON_ID=163516 /ORGANISM="Leptocylindrus danicus var. apora, Strain B651" /LENGTH=741 /DNA_ID=CAMNT_0003544339 /DNA_START=37 /DNA_END=2262 /DNA_ORIENTATION=+